MTRFITSLLFAIVLLYQGAQAADLPSGIRVTPQPGAVMQSISSFTISAGWLSMKFGTSTAEILVNGRSYETALSLSENYENLTFTLDTPINNDGTYNIIIAEDTFLIGWEDDPNPVIEFTYIIEGGTGGDTPGGDDTVQNTVPEGYTFTPAAGSEVPVLSTFAVEASAEMFLTQASRRPQITINGERVDVISNVSGTADNILTWTLAKPINTPGHYTIYIPEGTFYGYSETDNAPFLVTVIVTGGELPEPDWYSGEVTSDPATGSSVKELKKIAVMYPKLTSAYVGPEAGGITVTSDAGAVEAAYTLTPDEDTFNEAHVMWLEFNEAITAEGDYTISFPAQCFEIAKYPSNWYSAPFTLTFKVTDDSAIADIDADGTAAPAEYFTLGGVSTPRPTVPGIYLCRRGSVTTKVAVR